MKSPNIFDQIRMISCYKHNKPDSTIIYTTRIDPFFKCTTYANEPIEEDHRRWEDLVLVRILERMKKNMNGIGFYFLQGTQTDQNCK